MKNLISVIVPIYNTEKYLKRCVDSLIKQSFQNMEIILVDDGSTDSSPAIADEYAAIYSGHIRVIHKKNGGLSSARNTGLDLANGRCCSFIDSDDYVDADMYEKMFMAMQDSNADIAICGRTDEYIDKKVVRFCMNEVSVLTDEELMRRMLTWDCADIAAVDKLYRMRLWEGVRFPEGRNNEDICIIPYVVGRSNCIVHVPEPFYHYCHRKNSITTTYNENKVNDFYNAVEEIAGFVRKRYPLIEEELTFYLNHQYLALLVMMETIHADRKDQRYAKAKAYLVDNWDDSYSFGRMSTKERLIKKVIDLRLYNIVKAIYKLKSGREEKYGVKEIKD